MEFGSSAVALTKAGITEASPTCRLGRGWRVKVRPGPGARPRRETFKRERGAKAAIVLAVREGMAGSPT